MLSSAAFSKGFFCLCDLLKALCSFSSPPLPIKKPGTTLLSLLLNSFISSVVRTVEASSENGVIVIDDCLIPKCMNVRSMSSLATDWSKVEER